METAYLNWLIRQRDEAKKILDEHYEMKDYEHITDDWKDYMSWCLVVDDLTKFMESGVHL